MPHWFMSLKKSVQLAGIQINIGLGTTFTLLDRLAMFLAKSAEAAKDASIWVSHLNRKMVSLIGLAIKEGQDLTVAFVRFVFLRLHHKVSDMVRQVGYRIG
jgi:triacylglycerol lipase